MNLLGINSPWGGFSQVMADSLKGLVANAGPDPTDAHNAAVQKALADAGYGQQAPGAAPSLAPQSPPVMPATQPEPLRDTIQNAMPEQSPVPQVETQPSDAGVGAIEPSLPAPTSQLPQQSGLSMPQQYQFPQQQIQTVLDTLRRGAQIQ